MTHALPAEESEESESELAAGEPSTWVPAMMRALAGDQAADVPCGTCTACCTSSQFIHVAPTELDALAHIPSELLFPAPGLPTGHVLMGYDERGHCPMFVDGGCSIYDHRPRACRTYDCRVFAATNVEPDADKPRIARQARRWRFDVVTEDDRVTLDAVRASASFLRANPGRFPQGRASSPATPLAVLAIEAHEAFLLPEDDTGRLVPAQPSVDEVTAHIETRRPAPR